VLLLGKAGQEGLDFLSAGTWLVKHVSEAARFPHLKATTATVSPTDLNNTIIKKFIKYPQRQEKTN